MGDFEFIGNRRSDNIINFSLFYSSGMNAILALFLFFQKLYSNKVINTYFSGGYFETIELLKTFPIFHVNYNTLNNDNRLSLTELEMLNELAFLGIKQFQRLNTVPIRGY